MKRVLIVEDESACAGLYSELLEREGYAVRLARTVAGALEVTGPWDGLLLDLTLPDGDGRRVAAAYPGVPCLTISGHAHADLQKPVSNQRFCEAVRARFGPPDEETA